MKTDWNILDHVPLGIFVVNQDFQIVFWNECIVDWLRVSKNQAQGNSVFEFFPQLQGERHRIRLEGLFEGGPPVIFSSQLHPNLLAMPGQDEPRPIYHVTVSSVPALQLGRFHALFAVENVTELTQRVNEARRLQKLTEDLMKELNHRVKNHLSLVSGFILLQEEYLDDPKIVGFLENLKCRIQSIALLHEKLYQKFEGGVLDLVDYLRSLVEELAQGLQRPEDQILFHSPLQTYLLGGEQGLYLGLILNELVTNALKYGRKEGAPCQVRVELTQEDQGPLTLVVQDWGPGLPKDYALNGGNTLGNRLLASLVDSLRGHLLHSSTPGARFELRVPPRELL